MACLLIKKFTDNRFGFLTSLAALIIFLCDVNQGNAQPLETVPHVDIDRYLGTWYEISSFPQRFQKGCHRTTADYSLSKKGHIIVENRCNRGNLSGKQSHIKGKAFVKKHTGNAKLKVQFFWPFRGKYWIIDLANDYSYAVVGHPNRKYLWILSRTPEMDQDVYEQILTRIRKKGFDIRKLLKTPQL